MASSVQQVRENVATMPEKEKAAVDEVLREAKSYLVTNNINNDQITAMAVGTIRSAHSRQMRYYKSKNWTGNFMVRIPELINGGDRAVVVHKGSKGAVIYGLQPNATRPLGWLLPWSKPDMPNQPNKVYAEGGPLERILNKDWNEVEQKLDMSGDYCHHWDKESGAMVTAGIQDDSEKVALVGSTISYTGGEGFLTPN
ncbi:jasmonate-induced protein homolog [Chenopodium quinoa]|uniref:jasmonate-induced protein homolog n=1 Tax=Chenopodium quinoa TaxID=63459 RepID=UPI000B77F680|nr:jasmonate-induced protein homolog [Chenopodium quinoa]